MPSIDQVYSIIPFATAFLLVLFAPLLNSVWKSSYEDYYRRNYRNPNPTFGQLEAGAEWAVDISLAVPNVALTVIGILLLRLPVDAIVLAAICVIVMVFLIGTAVAVAHRQALTERKRSVVAAYSPLTLTQLGLNALGIIIALVLPLFV